MPRHLLGTRVSMEGGEWAGCPGIWSHLLWAELEGPQPLASPVTLQPQPFGRHPGDFCLMSEHYYNLFHACLNFKFIF